MRVSIFESFYRDSSLYTLSSPVFPFSPPIPLFFLFSSLNTRELCHTLLSPRLYLIYFLSPCILPSPFSPNLSLLLSLALPLLFSPPRLLSLLLFLLSASLLSASLSLALVPFSLLFFLVFSLLLLLLLSLALCRLFSSSLSFPLSLFFPFRSLSRCPLSSVPFFLLLLFVLLRYFPPVSPSMSTHSR